MKWYVLLDTKRNRFINECGQPCYAPERAAWFAAKPLAEQVAREMEMENKELTILIKEIEF